MLRYFDAITWNNPYYGQSIKKHSLSFTGPFDPFTEYGKLEFCFSQHVQTPDSKMQTQSHTMEISYFINFLKKSFYKPLYWCGWRCFKAKKTSDWWESSGSSQDFHDYHVCTHLLSWFLTESSYTCEVIIYQMQLMSNGFCRSDLLNYNSHYYCSHIPSFWGFSFIMTNFIIDFYSYHIGQEVGTVLSASLPTYPICTQFKHHSCQHCSKNGRLRVFKSWISTTL